MEPRKIELEELLDRIYALPKSGRPKVVVVAGESASGKSYLAKKLEEELSSDGLRVSTISTDDFYINETREAAAGIGNYDHPLLVGRNGKEVREAVSSGLTDGRINVPVYSFETASRKGYRQVSVGDVLIVEGLHAIDFLGALGNITVYVEPADSKELVFRRLVRDIERAKLTPDKTLEFLAGAAAMARIHVRPQRERADFLHVSEYSILQDVGTREYQVKISRRDFERLEKSEEKTFEIEDTYYGDWPYLRIRMIQEGRHKRVELAYREKREEELREVTTWKYVSDREGFYTLAHTVAQLMGLEPSGGAVRKTRTVYRASQEGIRIYRDEGMGREVYEIAADSKALLEGYLRNEGVEWDTRSYLDVLNAPERPRVFYVLPTGDIHEHLRRFLQGAQGPS